MHPRISVKSWILTAAVSLLAACAGGGGDGSDGDRTPREAIDGVWTFPCQDSGGEWHAETVSFDASAGTVRHARERHAISDCSDPGVVLAQEQGGYSVGKTVDCAGGSGLLCTPIDFAWEGGDKGYAVFSVDETGDPDLLWLSDVEPEPAQRPANVDLSTELRRIAFPGQHGHAILDLYLVDGGYDSSPPQPAAGYERLAADLNTGSGGHYIWLYYQLGRADGADGTPLGAIYTVDQADGETPKRGGKLLPVNLNAGPIVGHELWLYKLVATDSVMRCIAFANPTDGYTRYGPTAIDGDWRPVWVEELKPDSLKSPWPEYPPDVQDLNEGEGPWTDYLYLGYCAGL